MPNKKPTSKTMYVIQRKSDGLFYKRASETDRFRKDNTWTDNLLEAHLFKSTGHAKQTGVWFNKKLTSSGKSCCCTTKIYIDEKNLKPDSVCNWHRCVAMMWVPLKEEDFPQVVLPVKVKVELGKVK